MIKRLTAFALVAAMATITPAFGASAPAPNQPGAGSGDQGWPRQITSGNWTLTAYQPQIDKWDGYRLDGHQAFAIAATGDETQTFGVAYLRARTDVDKGTRTVTLNNVTVDSVNFPSAPDKAETLKQAAQKLLDGKTWKISQDRIESQLAVAQAEQKGMATPPKNDPPVIIFSAVPAILVYIDGQPVYKPVNDTPLQRVINTRPLLLKDSAGKHYLKVFDGWLTAPSLTGKYAVTKSTPDLEKALKAAEAGGQVDLLSGKTDSESSDPPPSLSKGVPVIYPVTQPSELIVTDGAPNYVPIEGTQLLYAKNSTGDVFRNLSDQKIYVLISGRWFRSAATKGPWEYVPGDALPPDFAKMPDTSPKENVKASVPGTPQAEEAVIANSIPETATVNLKEARMDQPQFDGQPKMEPIEGTPLKYVPNTQVPIIVVDNSVYYSVVNGVWFRATSLSGPWAVATTVPAVIYSIPPSSPLYYVTYVRVYYSTPEVVYVGYYPGYYGAYVYNGAVIYGTGYYYRPWIGAYWWGPPVTYGFGVNLTYTPWTGWTLGFGFGLAWGWGLAATVGWAWGARPWYGPAAWGVAYRPGRGAAAWGPGGWAVTTGNVYGRWGGTTVRTRTSQGYNAWTGNRWASQTGMSYNSRTGTIAAGQRAAVGNAYTGNYAAGKRGSVTTAAGASASGGKVTVGNARTGQSASAGRVQVSGPGGNTGSISAVSGEKGTVVKAGDNVFATKDGGVYRPSGSGGWEQVGGGGQWQGVQNTQTTQQLNQQAQARQTGQQRTQQYDQGAYRSAGQSQQVQRQPQTRPAQPQTRPAQPQTRPASGGGKRK